MKQIYIVLTNTGTWFSKTIQQYTDAPFNHASLSLDLELNELYSFGRKKAKNPFRAGFVKEDVLYGVYRHFPNTTCAIYALTVTEEQFETIYEVIQEFKQNEKYYRYNLLGLLGFLIQRPITFNNMYFCSQFVCEVLQRSEVCMQEEQPPLISPDDFRRLENATLIFEGNLFSYPPILTLTQKTQALKKPPVPRKKRGNILSHHILSLFHKNT